MKNSNHLIWFGALFSSFLSAQVELPPYFKAAYAFELHAEEDQKTSKSLIEHLSFGEQSPSLLSINGGEKVFFMDPPRVDRCGFLHFEGSAVVLENKREVRGDETRFYELPLKIDVSCHPVPFPRCGTFRSTENASSGEYLMEQLQLYRAKCQAVLVQGAQVEEFYEIGLSKGLDG